jgi:outer membrane protein assembly factor BamB
VCCYDGVVYATGTSGYLYAMDAATGEPVWEGRLGIAGQIDKAREANEALPGNRPIVTDAPMAIDGVVAVGNRHLTAFDAKTGAVAWPEVQDRKQNPRRFNTGAGGALILKTWQHDGQGYFYAGGRLFHAKTGRLCWDIAADPAIDHVKTKDGAIAGDIVVSKVSLNASAAAEEKSRRRTGALAAFRMTPDGYQRLWVIEKPCKSRPDVVIHAGHVYVMFGPNGPGPDPGQTTCIDLNTGKIVSMIEHDKNTKNRWGYIPLAAEGRLIFGFRAPGLLKTDPLDFRYLTTVSYSGAGSPLPRSECVGYAYVDGFLYLRGESQQGAHLYCLDLRKSR